MLLSHFRLHDVPPPNTWKCKHLLHYCLQRSCEGYVFTGVCLSTQGGGICLSACWDTTPPGSRHPPGADPPWERTPSQSRHPPGPDTPRSRHPPKRQPLLQTVRILLECILVPGYVYWKIKPGESERYFFKNNISLNFREMNLSWALTIVLENGNSTLD